MKFVEIKTGISLGNSSIFLILLLGAGAGFIVSPIRMVSSDVERQQGPRPTVIENNLREHLQKIASDGFEGRGAGYEGERKTIEYIATEFRKYGLRPVGDKIGGRKTYFQKFAFHPRKPERPFEVLKSSNVVGFIEGSDKELKKEIVVIGCHHDGQGREGQADGGRLAGKIGRNDKIWNSADDNGTSVAVLLEVARVISARKLKPKRSIVFATFGAEEHALNGSAYYVSNPVFKWERHVAMLNIEKLGRIPDALPITASSGTSPVWDKITAVANQKTGMEVKSIIRELISDTDHYPFAMRKIPAMVIGMAHEEDTHLPTDSVEKISFGKLTERAEYVLAAFLELANTEEKMLFAGDLKNEVGLMPVELSDDEVNRLGLGPGQGGLKVSMIIPDFPADNAGMKEGDIITEVNGKKIERSEAKERLFFKENISKAGIMNLGILRDGKPKLLKLKFY